MTLYWDTPEGLDPKAPLWAKEGNASAWEPWFAWHPVKTHKPREAFGKWTWLRWIERRTFYCAPWFCIHSFVEYRRGYVERERLAA